MLEKLKQKIVEAVPEIMDKQNGCKIQYDLDGKTWSGEMYTNAFFWHLRVDNVYAIDDREIRDSIKILGRPITLEDVLRAIPMEFKAKIMNNNTIQIDRIINGSNKDNWFHWKLGKPLSEQSKPTQEFLYKLLK